MDENGDCLVHTPTPTPTLANKSHMFIKRTLQFLVPVSLFSFFLSYFSGFPIFLSYYNLQFSSLVFPLFDQALDRKYMFLICNGILAFLAKSLKFSSSYGGVPVKSIDDDLQGITELPQVLQVAAVHEEELAPVGGRISVEEKQIAPQQEQDVGEVEEIKTGGFVLENIVSDEEPEDYDYYNELKGGTIEEDTPMIEEEVNVSTEELNRKIEEFIRKMKEEIRIEAQQQQLIAV